MLPLNKEDFRKEGKYLIYKKNLIYSMHMMYYNKILIMWFLIMKNTKYS